MNNPPEGNIQSCLIPDICLDDYNYPLMNERIAKYPLPCRDQSKLLIYKDKNIREDSFNQLSNYLPANTLLVFNNTKVIHARLFFQKDTGSQIEILCLEPDKPSNYEQSFICTRECTWICLVGHAKK